jgi:dTDP-4-dehydrorhamnose 3,5-epimerase
MTFTRLNHTDVWHFSPKKYEDARGWFMETYSQAKFVTEGIYFSPVQENQSFSKAAGTVRGLHFQRAPFAQAKLVRVLRGSIFDVAVDIRPNSPKFMHWVSVELSAVKGDALFIPKGFAHGFCTLEPDCEISYLVDNYYAPECDGAILWNDQAIGVSWPEGAGTSLSEKDAKAPLLANACIDGR